MKMLARLFAGLVALMLGLVAWSATLPFDQAGFDRAVASGAPVVVQFHADWCPTCRAQKPIVTEVLAEPRMKKVTFFIADFDKETALKKALRVQAQSTFVVYKAGREVARSTGQTSRAAIDEVFAKAL